MRLAAIVRDNRATIVVALAVAALLSLSWVVLLRTGRSGEDLVARVHDGEGRVYLLPLDRDDRLVISTPLGTNVVEVEDGAVHMADADCPNRTCLDRAPLSAPGPQIICLPHHLWVEVVPTGSGDTQMDVSQAQGTYEDVDLVAR